jgi:phosphoribosylglycinamide formyltransferase-1
MNKTKIAVLVSGGGTNLQALIDSVGTVLQSGELALVLSGNRGAYALERAAKAGIPAAVIARKEYPDTDSFCAALADRLRAEGIGLVILAGFLSILNAEFIRAFPNRIINVHPSLIPSFCGKGFYGLKVHEEALARGVKVTGATVHFVNEGADEGPIILQKAVDVNEGDTPEVLQRRVMEQAEWKLLPRAAALFCADRLEVEGRTVHIKEEL